MHIRNITHKTYTNCISLVSHEENCQPSKIKFSTVASFLWLAVALLEIDPKTSNSESWLRAHTEAASLGEFFKEVFGGRPDWMLLKHSFAKKKIVTPLLCHFCFCHIYVLVSYMLRMRWWDQSSGWFGIVLVYMQMPGQCFLHLPELWLLFLSAQWWIQSQAVLLSISGYQRPSGRCLLWLHSFIFCREHILAYPRT